MSVCPGIVELTQRFNRVSFWVISVILQKQTNKIRSEVVQQFIKIAKRLHDLRKMLKGDMEADLKVRSKYFL